MIAFTINFEPPPGMGFCLVVVAVIATIHFILNKIFPPN